MGGRVHIDALRARVGSRAPASRVTSTELFFDLVFVFTITQLTIAIEREASPAGFARVLLILMVTFWMYGGYAWLTNTVPPVTPVARVLLLVGMVGFLVMALAVPTAFGRGGVAFGAAYLVVVAVHSALYVSSSDEGAVRSILRIAPVNAVSGLVVLAAGAVDGAADWVLWSLAVALQVSTRFFSGMGNFPIQPGHFVERHGLVVIIALGESVVAIGVNAASQPLGPALVAACVLALSLTVLLWWTYFAAEEELAERALEEAAQRDRSIMALQAFGYSFVPLLLGIVLVAAGVAQSLTRLGAVSPHHAAWFLGGGVACYLGGVVCFRTALGVRPLAVRAGGALAAAVTVPLGLAAPAGVQMALLVAVLAFVLAVEADLTRRRSRPDRGPAVRVVGQPG